MQQFSMFPEMVPNKQPRKRKAKAQQMSMFTDGELFGGGVARATVPANPRLFDLVLAYPDETESEAVEREARQAHINTLF